MLNRSASLTMSTSILKALPGTLDNKRHSPSILYIHLSHPKYDSYKIQPQLALWLLRKICVKSTLAES